MGLYLGILLWRAAPKDRPARRKFLQGAAASLAVAPYVATAIGIICRDRFSVNEVNVHIPNLPRDLDGIRLVQITDIHLSPFLTENEFARAIVQGRVEVLPISADEAARPAPRPANSALVSARWQAAGLRPLPDWERALTDYFGDDGRRR